MHAEAGAPIVKAWIGDRDIEVKAWLVDGGDVTLHLAGVDAPGSAADLAESLATAFGSPVVVRIEYEAIERFDAAAAPG